MYNFLFMVNYFYLNYQTLYKNKRSTFRGMVVVCWDSKYSSIVFGFLVVIFEMEVPLDKDKSKKIIKVEVRLCESSYSTPQTYLFLQFSLIPTEHHLHLLHISNSLFFTIFLNSNRTPFTHIPSFVRLTVDGAHFTTTTQR